MGVERALYAWAENEFFLDKMDNAMLNYKML